MNIIHSIDCLTILTFEDYTVIRILDCYGFVVLTFNNFPLFIILLILHEQEDEKHEEGVTVFQVHVIILNPTTTIITSYLCI